MLTIDIAALTDAGARGHNEDDFRHGGRAPLWHAVLADGAGGHDGGSIASDLVVRLVALRLAAPAALDPLILREALLEAHAALGERQTGRQARERMHTTVVALWVDADREEALWGHVGRFAPVHAARRAHLHVTRDDSLMQQMVDAGLLTTTQARTHPGRNQLLCAMGMDEALQPHTTDEPQLIRDGDAFLLASDGWWDPLEATGIEASFAEARTPTHWLDLMAARVRAQQRADQDNFSAVALWVGDPSQATRIRAR